MTKVKICGLKRIEDIKYANRLLPDYAGFVFADSPRQISPEEAQQLRSQLDPKIQSVGVFVNQEIDFIKQLVLLNTINLVQLHGDENTNYCARLRQEVKVPIIKVLRVVDTDSLRDAGVYDCDYLLLDTYNKSFYGGSGQRFSHKILEQAKLPKPYFIAGGLNADNVGAALSLGAYAVDVSSGVETNGIKDFEKMQAFIAQVKGNKKDD